VYVYAHKKSGCKGTKKNPHTQIYVEKNEKFVVFVRDLASFGGVWVLDNQKKKIENADSTVTSRNLA